MLSQVFAVDHHLKMIVLANLSKFSGKLRSLEIPGLVVPDTAKRPSIGFRDPEFPIFETRDAGL